MQIDQKELQRRLSGPARILYDEPMKNHTTFKIGGPADCLIQCACEEDIPAAAGYAREQGIPFLIIGNGSDLLVSDLGIRGMVIKTCTQQETIRRESDTELWAPAGATLSALSAAALKEGLSGLEFAFGIPGTVGGAVYMNAGAYGGEMKDVVVKTRYVDADGELYEVVGIEHQFRYRGSRFTNSSDIILSTTVRLSHDDPAAIKARMDDFSNRRRTKQPLSMPSAGSVFKRPEGYFAGKLIEDCGLKGFQVGEARVSPLHAGFIVNEGGATAQDVLDLVAYIQKTVEERFGVSLECEIKFVGERKG